MANARGRLREIKEMLGSTLVRSPAVSNHSCEEARALGHVVNCPVCDMSRRHLWLSLAEFFRVVGMINETQLFREETLLIEAVGIERYARMVKAENDTAFAGPRYQCSVCQRFLAINSSKRTLRDLVEESSYARRSSLSYVCPHCRAMVDCSVATMNDYLNNKGPDKRKRRVARSPELHEASTTLKEYASMLPKRQGRNRQRRSRASVEVPPRIRMLLSRTENDEPPF